MPAPAFGAFILVAGVGIGLALYYIFSEEHQHHYRERPRSPSPPRCYRERSPSSVRHRRTRRESPPPGNHYREPGPSSVPRQHPPPENRTATVKCETCRKNITDERRHLDCGHIFHNVCYDVWHGTIESIGISRYCPNCPF